MSGDEEKRGWDLSIRISETEQRVVRDDYLERRYSSLLHTREMCRASRPYCDTNARRDMCDRSPRPSS